METSKQAMGASEFADDEERNATWNATYWENKLMHLQQQLYLVKLD